MPIVTEQGKPKRKRPRWGVVVLGLISLLPLLLFVASFFVGVNIPLGNHAIALDFIPAEDATDQEVPNSYARPGDVMKVFDLPGGAQYFMAFLNNTPE
jgi:hypothetical protein